LGHYRHPGQPEIRSFDWWRPGRDAVYTGILLCKCTLTKDAEGKVPYSQEEMKSPPEGALAYPQYDWQPKVRLVSDGKPKYLVDVANQLLKETPDAMILLPKEEHEYTLDLKFGLGNSRKDPDAWVEYDRLTDLMKLSDV
jgi:hypothetical protein